jgi:hypothetical protein
VAFLYAPKRSASDILGTSSTAPNDPEPELLASDDIPF